MRTFFHDISSVVFVIWKVFVCVSFKASKTHVTLKIAKRGSNFDTNPRGSKRQNSRVHTFTYSAVATSFTSDAGVFAGHLAYFMRQKWTTQI